MTIFVCTKRQPKGKGKKPEVVIVTASYKATGPEQLSLEKGQLIQVKKKNSSGWWEGETQVKGKKKEVGWFPATYVKPLNAPAGASDTSAPTVPDVSKIPSSSSDQLGESAEHISVGSNMYTSFRARDFDLSVQSSARR